jgi:predicted RNase H-like HicB family nuclease/DNA-binding XRE family transcriptional regulator
MMRYPATVRTEEGAWIVLFPDCPGCQTQVDRGEDLLAMAEDALSGWLEAHLQGGEVPPRPSSKVRVGRGSKLIWVDVFARLAIKLAIRWARHGAGLTQVELARRAGVTQPAVAQLEHPDSNPTLDTLERVASALGVRLCVALEPLGRARRGRPSRARV